MEDPVLERRAKRLSSHRHAPATDQVVYHAHITEVGLGCVVHATFCPAGECRNHGAYERVLQDLVVPADR